MDGVGGGISVRRRTSDAKRSIYKWSSGNSPMDSKSWKCRDGRCRPRNCSSIWWDRFVQSISIWQLISPVSIFQPGFTTNTGKSDCSVASGWNYLLFSGCLELPRFIAIPTRLPHLFDDIPTCRFGLDTHLANNSKLKGGCNG